MKKTHMISNVLRHGLGIRDVEYEKCEYEGQVIYIYVRTKEKHLKCSSCGSKRVIKKGKIERDFRSVPIGRKAVIIVAKIQRLQCKDCGKIRQERLSWADEKKGYTKQLSKYTLDLLSFGTIQDVSKWTGLSWHTVKQIEKQYLKRHYEKPRLKDLRFISIDEFAVRKGHEYMTVVMDILTGRIVYVGEGKDAAALDYFWKRLRSSGAKVEAVTIDMSKAYIKAVTEKLPQALIVFDWFHIVKQVNEAVDEVRRAIVREENTVQLRQVVKGTRWLLLKKGYNLNRDKDEKEKLEEALQLNKPLATAYYMKEELEQLRYQESEVRALDFLYKWYKRASASGVKQLQKVGNMLMSHRSGILNWFRYQISSGKLEGLNNKIKVLKRKAYGYRDMEFFKLKLYALHDCKLEYAFIR